MARSRTEDRTIDWTDADAGGDVKRWQWGNALTAWLVISLALWAGAGAALLSLF